MGLLLTLGLDLKLLGCVAVSLCRFKCETARLHGNEAKETYGTAGRIQSWFEVE